MDAAIILRYIIALGLTQENVLFQIASVDSFIYGLKANICVDERKNALGVYQSGNSY